MRLHSWQHLFGCDNNEPHLQAKPNISCSCSCSSPGKSMFQIAGVAGYKREREKEQPKQPE